MNMGFLISHKNQEARRALLPEAIASIRNKGSLVFETRYGDALGRSDWEYINAGAQVVDRDDCLKCDILVDVKLDAADYLDAIDRGKVLVGWAHATQQVDFTSAVMNGDHTVIAWEEIYEDGRYIFYRNREVAGEAAILHGFRYCGKMPYDATVCILGNGHTAKGCLRILQGLGATVDVYPRKFEDLFKKKMYCYDVVVNCVMWDTTRTDRIIYKSDLNRFKPGTLIIDVSCDPYLEIETSHPTTIDEPVYEVDGIIHYAVDNTPAMYPATVTEVLSKGFKDYVDEIIEGKYSPPIENAVVLRNGHIVYEGIRSFREKRGLFVR